jgi:hypothetical protein
MSKNDGGGNIYIADAGNTQIVVYITYIYILSSDRLEVLSGDL